MGIYFILTSLILLPLTTLSVYKFEQDIYGRYIDPIIPGIFLFGLIGLYFMHNDSKRPNFKIMSIVGITLTIFFFINFPSLKAEEFPILYANPLMSVAPNWIVFPVLSAGFFFLLNAYKILAKDWRNFFAILIAFSICTSAYSYSSNLLYQSDRYHSMNQIGAYLNEHSGTQSMVIMDNEIPVTDWYFDSITSFWVKRNFDYMQVNENLLSIYKDEKNDVFIITSKALPLEPLAYSANGHYLYKLNSTSY